MNKKNDLLIFIVLIIFELSFLFVLSKIISGNVKLLVNKKEKLAVLKQRSKNLNKLEEDYILLQEDIKIIDSALPDKELIVDFISDLEKQASSSGVLAKISFGSKSIIVEPGGLKNLSFSINLKGTYFSITEFLKQIEKMHEVIIVDKIVIQSPIGIEGENNAVLNVKCYVDSKF